MANACKADTDMLTWCGDREELLKEANEHE